MRQMHLMKGQMVLEYPFNILLYTVVIVILIAMIITFRNRILTSLNLCQYTPQGCQPQQCSAIQATETVINEAVLTKYCNLCWQKTGNVNYKSDCLCYAVSGSFFPVAFSNQNCQLTCNKDATSVLFSYDSLLKKVYITC